MMGLLLPYMVDELNILARLAIFNWTSTFDCAGSVYSRFLNLSEACRADHSTCGNDAGRQMTFFFLPLGF